jgi:hypothetical protein
MERLYRYTTNGEGVWSAGKRLLPQELVEEVNQNRAWLPKPDLPQGEYRFYMKEKGKSQYENTLMKVHQKYLSNILCEEVDSSTLGQVVYQDEWQVVTRA